MVIWELFRRETRQPISIENLCFSNFRSFTIHALEEKWTFPVQYYSGKLNDTWTILKGYFAVYGRMQWCKRHIAYSLKNVTTAQLS